jgi:SAM-dependent methyltransferase
MSEKHFIEQKNHAESYLIPYFERHLPGFRRFRILEVGCAEAGFLDALYEYGISSAGLELEPHRIALAKTMNPNLELNVGDIANPGIVSRLGKTYHLIVMRDVIEHISDKDSTFQNLRQLLNPDGYLYITFPPKFSPFGGHHQNGRSILRKLPYLQLLPPVLIRFLGRIFREHPQIIENTITNFRIGLSMRHFESLYKTAGFQMHMKELFLFRPVYQTRMGLKHKRLPDIPIVRELITFGYECLLQKSG